MGTKKKKTDIDERSMYGEGVIIPPEIDEEDDGKDSEKAQEEPEPDDPGVSALSKKLAEEESRDVSVKNLQDELEEAINLKIELESKNTALLKQASRFEKKEADTGFLTTDHVVKPLVLLEDIETCVQRIEKSFGLLGSSLKIKNQVAQHIQKRVDRDLGQIKLTVATLKAAQIDVAKHSGL